MYIEQISRYFYKRDINMLNAKLKSLAARHVKQRLTKSLEAKIQWSNDVHSTLARYSPDSAWSTTSYKFLQTDRRHQLCTIRGREAPTSIISLQIHSIARRYTRFQNEKKWDMEAFQYHCCERMMKGILPAPWPIPRSLQGLALYQLRKLSC